MPEPSDLPTINEIESLGRASAEHASQLLEEGIAESGQERVDTDDEESDGEVGVREEVDRNADEATDPETAGQEGEPPDPSSHPQSADNPPDEKQHV